MSPVDRIQALWSVYKSAGPLATIEQLPDDCEWIPPADLRGGEVVRGAHEIRAYLERLEHDGVRVEPSLHSYEQLSEHVVLVGGRMRVVSRAALSDSPLYWLCRMRDDRVVRIESYACRGDALSAAA
ncbi:MAG TPA: hypothetical protein VF529_21900 [Solirubrobacteraceae bacterium]